MLAKIEITGTIRLKTGMHIGATEAFAAIGAIDSPVVRDPESGLPCIPGSSLKGKIRSLLAKAYNDGIQPKAIEHQDERIKRLFGCSENASGYPQASRVIFSDTVLSNCDELNAKGVSFTEAKEENSINPLTAIANPRQIERVVKGAEFPLTVIYNAVDPETVEEDIRLLSEGFKLLQYDYIGGHGSRGYGRVELFDFEVDCVIGDLSEELMKKCELQIKTLERNDEV